MHLHPCGCFHTLDGITVRLEEGRKFLHNPIQLLKTIYNTLPLQCDIGAICFVLAAWTRYAGNANSLSPNSAYTLLIFGQVRPVALLPPPPRGQAHSSHIIYI